MGGPDMAKMLQMMMPYMDPATKRMMSIMMNMKMISKKNQRKVSLTEKKL